MIKVLFCTNTLDNTHHGPAKFAKILLDLNNRFDNIELRILTPDIDRENVIKNTQIYRLIINKTIFYNFIPSIVILISYYKRVLELSNVFDYDIVIFNNVISSYLCVKKIDKPIIGFINDDNNILFSVSHFKLSKHWFKRSVLKWLESKSCNKCDLVVANSKYLASLINKFYGINPDKIKLLYKAVNFNNSQIKIRRFNEILKILFVKSDFVRGGLQDLIIALENCKEKQFELTIVGPTSKYFDMIKSWFSNSTNVKYNILGPQSQESVFSLMREANIFCVPSRMEALGVANMEALSLGLPVISTKVGGIVEVMDNGRCGWLANGKNPYDLSKAFIECIENEKLRIEKINYGLKYVENNFSKEKLLLKFLEIVKIINLN